MSDVEEVMSSSIDPDWRKIFHLCFFTQRLIRFSTLRTILSCAMAISQGDSPAIQLDSLNGLDDGLFQLLRCVEST